MYIKYRRVHVPMYTVYYKLTNTHKYISLMLSVKYYSSVCIYRENLENNEAEL